MLRSFVAWLGLRIRARHHGCKGATRPVGTPRALVRASAGFPLLRGADLEGPPGDRRARRRLDATPANPLTFGMASRHPLRRLLEKFRRPPRDEAAPVAEHRPDIGEGATVRHYELLERLGEGAMGVVYRARDTKLDRLVALKFLPDHVSARSDAAERFRVEARAAARLDHPNICTIHEIGTLENGRSFIAMALYEGDTLSSVLADRGPLPPGGVAEIGLQVARGLARAHAAEIVHRDIKPANLFLTSEGIVKILDFGIAKMAGVELTESGAAVGTIAYMSPEQLQGEVLDARADLWALGVVLYELCGGEHPFAGPDRVAVMHAILTRDPPPLESLREGVPERLVSIVHRCLEKDPSDRPDDAAALISTLEAVVAGAAAPDPERATETPAPSLVAEGERRPATLLVAELAGLGALEESLAPDERDELLEGCREAMESLVTAHGGVVNRASGERLQALFGVPAAREDDATRAVRAARALCDRVGEICAGATGVGSGIGLRCGVDSGRVVARPTDAEDGGYRVVGEAAERSARLAGQARPGELLISAPCRRLIAPFFETEPGGVLPGRGEEAPTEVFRVKGATGARSRLEAAATAGLTDLAGRDVELRALLEACELVAEDGGRFVSVVGEAGVGKSRLLWEFEQRIEPDRFDIVHGRCQSFGGEVPYLPFIGVLRDRLDLGDAPGAEDPDLVRERVRSIAPELEDFVPFYLQLLSVGDEDRPLQEALTGEQLRVGLVESLSSLVTLGARDRPTVVLLEDWHWVDAASNQVVRQLLEMVTAYPLLIVVSARPEAELDWGAPAAHTPIVLGPLTREDSDAILRSVLGAGEVPSPLVRFLHERTGGNPFFLEEVCHALREEGTLRVERGRVIVGGALHRLELPETVQGVLRTRLDRLDGPTRRLVGYAAVVGREFGRDVLERALPDATDLDDGLARLRDLGIIQQIRVVPNARYRFKHALTQEAAYDSLLERQRAEIHGAVGDALEALHPDRPDDLLDRLAEHFARAGRWEKAVDYAVAATDRLWSFSEFQEASEVQARALEWVEHLAGEEARFERRVELLLRQERLFEYLGLRDRQQEIIDELREMLDPERHIEHLATTHVRQGDLCILTRDHEGAERALEAAIRLSEAGEPALARHALRSLGLLRWHQERHEEAVDLVERALAMDRQLGHQESVIGNLSNLGSLYKGMGRYDRALEYLRQALDLERNIERRDAGLVVKESYILHTMGEVYSAMGDHDRALEYLERARDCITRTSSTRYNVVQLHFHLIAIARLFLEEGRLDEALELYEESVELTRKTRHLEGLSTSLRLLGEVLLNLERHHDALPYLEEAAELYARMRDRPAEARMWRGVATAREGVGGRDAALEAWERARRIARELRDRKLELEAEEGRGRLLRGEDPTGALEAYERALELAADDRHPARRGDLRYTIGLLHWEFGAYEEALRSFEAAYGDHDAGGDAVRRGVVLNSIGRTLRDLGRLEEAEERLESALALHREAGQPLLEAHALATLGHVHLDRGDPEPAARRFEAALEIRRALGDLPGQGWMLLRLAEAQAGRGSSEGVAYYLDEAEEVASRADDPELARRCETLRRESGA